MTEENTLRYAESSWMMVWNGTEYEIIENFNTGAESDNDLEKAKSFGGDRSAAASYAARVRWGNRGETFDATAVPVRSQQETEAIVNGLFPRQSSDYFYPEDLTLIRGYQIDGGLVNRSLRAGASDDALPAAVKLDQVFLRPEQRLDQDIVLHRGLAIGVGIPLSETMGTQKFFEGLQVGESFRDRGFMSTSADVTTAASFGAKTGITFEVVVRKGTPILPIPHIMRGRLGNAFDDEAEVLLPRNGTFKVVSITSPQQGKKVIRVLADFPTPNAKITSEDE